MLTLGGVAFATDGFNFATVNANVTVIESMSIQIDGTGIDYIEWDGYQTIPNQGATFSMTEAKAGEYKEIPVRIFNSGYETINADIETSIQDYVTIEVTWVDTDNPNKVPGRRYGETTNYADAIVKVTVAGNTPPGYSCVLGFDFYRY